MKTIKFGQRLQLGRTVYDLGSEIPHDPNTETLLKKVGAKFSITGDEKNPTPSPANSLINMKVGELKDLAKQHDIDPAGLKKDELVSVLQEKVTEILSDVGDEDDSEEE